MKPPDGVKAKSQNVKAQNGGYLLEFVTPDTEHGTRSQRRQTGPAVASENEPSQTHSLNHELGKFPGYPVSV